MSSPKASSHLRRWEHITILQMCSPSSFKPRFLVSIFQNSISSKTQICLGCQDSQVGKEEVIVKEKTTVSASQVLSRVDRQACSQHQGQRSVQGHIYMLNFEAFEDQRETLTQRFRDASVRIRRALTPPPRRGSMLSESRVLSESRDETTQEIKMKSICSLKD